MRFRVTALLLPLTFLVAADAPKMPAGGARPIPVVVRTLEARALEYALDTTGSLETDEKKVCAEVSGVVRQVLFEEGDEVEPDKVLAAIDPEVYGLRALRAKASYEKAAAQLEEAGHALDRRRQLRAKNAGWVSEEEILQYESSLKESQASCEETRLAWKLAEEDEKRASVRPGVKGRIERRSVVAGQFLQVGAPIATLVDQSVLRLRFRVGGLEATRLTRGQAVSFKVKELPGESFQGVLFHIASETDPTTRTVDCVARVEPADPRLRAGHFSDVHLSVGRKDKAVTVPEGALLPTERGYVAFIVDADGKTARRRGVTLGLHTPDGEVEVLTGLASGDILIVRGAQLLTEGSLIATAPASTK